MATPQKKTPHTIKTKFFDFDEAATPGSWNARHELILKIWAEESICWNKMHTMAHTKYAFLNMKLTMPVIIMSTLTGTANFALSSFSEPWKSHIPIIIGSINLLSGMVTTIAQYLRVNESSEGHRVAALAYGKMARVVASELALAPDERSTDGISLVKRCRAEMDRLEEQGPDVNDDIIRQFWKRHELQLTRECIYLPSNIHLRGVVIYQPDNKDLEYRVTTPDSAGGALTSKRRKASESILQIHQKLKPGDTIAEEKEEAREGEHLV